MTSFGFWEAMEKAMEEPMLSGDTPVMSTIVLSTQCLMSVTIPGFLPLFPRIWSAKAFATSRPPVSWFHSGCVKVDMVTCDTFTMSSRSIDVNFDI
jgi:hypothetical protein